MKRSTSRSVRGRRPRRARRWSTDDSGGCEAARGSSPRSGLVRPRATPSSDREVRRRVAAAYPRTGLPRAWRASRRCLRDPTRTPRPGAGLTAPASGPQRSVLMFTLSMAASSRESARRGAGQTSSTRTRTASSPHHHRRASAKGPVSRPSARARHPRSGSAGAAAQVVRIPVRKYHDVAWRQLDI